MWSGVIYDTQNAPIIQEQSQCNKEISKQLVFPLCVKKNWASPLICL